MKISKMRTWFTPLLTGLVLSLSSSVYATEYSASFKGTDIGEFVNTVSRNLNKTVIIDPAVRGKVNVRSYDLLTETQYYQFFLNVLEVYGFAVVEMPNGVLKVIKSKDAKTSAIPVVDSRNPGKGDEMVTRVVPVRNVSVRELAPLLRQLNDNAGGGNVVHYDPSNVIMITGRAAVVNRLVEIVRRVDKAGDQEVDIISLKYASATEMVRIIESLNKSKGGKGSKSNPLVPKLVADERTNSIVVSGDPKARGRIANLIQRLDSELKSTGNTRVFYLKYANAKEIADVLKGVSDSVQKSVPKSKKKSSSKDSTSINAHEDTNALVITAVPDTMRTLESVIRQLDIRRAQVHIEAIIVEVAEGEGINLGVQWGAGDDGMIAGGVSFADGVSIPLTEIAAGAYAAQPTEGSKRYSPETGNLIEDVPDQPGDITALATTLSGLNGALLGYAGSNWAAILQAASNDTKSNILATPSLTTLDNQEAFFIVGEEVPTITGSTASSNNANPFSTVERREVGIKMTVTPQINEGGAIQLTIEQEVSQVKGSTTVDVVFAKRQVKTTVLIDSGKTVVIGGLIDEQVEESISKVPLLGDIPYLGYLFSSRSSKVKKRNLMIFLRPTIIREENDMTAISSRKYSQLRAEQIIQQEDGIELMWDGHVPILPEFPDKMQENAHATPEEQAKYGLDNNELPKEVQDYIDSTKDEEDAGVEQ